MHLWVPTELHRFVPEVYRKGIFYKKVFKWVSTIRRNILFCYFIENLVKATNNLQIKFGF